MRHFWALVALLLLVLAGTSLFPVPAVRADGELQVTVHSVDDSTNPASAIVTVLDPDKRPLAGLRPEQLTMDVNGAAAKVTSLERAVDAEVGISVVLAIQTSSTMAASLPQVRDATQILIQSLSPRDQAAIISFASEVKVEQPMTRDFAALGAALDRLQAGGNTVLYDAVVRSVAEAAQAPLSRKVVILLTNAGGMGQVSQATREQALAAAATSGVTVYALGFGSVVDRQFLEELALQGRGQALIAPALPDVARAYADIGTLLRSQYIVRFDQPAPASQPGHRMTITARAQQGSGSASFDYTTKRTIAAEPEVPPPAPAAVETTGSNNQGYLLLAGALLVLMASFGGAWVVWQRLLRPATLDYRGPLSSLNMTPADAEAAARDAPGALLRFESGQELAINGLVTLGVDPGCNFRLPLSTADFGHGQLRIWFANQRYLLHDVAARPRVKVNGRPVTWSVLADGDQIEVRDLKAAFHLAPVGARPVLVPAGVEAETGDGYLPSANGQNVFRSHSEESSSSTPHGRNVIPSASEESSPSTTTPQENVILSNSEESGPNTTDAPNAAAASSEESPPARAPDSLHRAPRKRRSKLSQEAWAHDQPAGGHDLPVEPRSRKGRRKTSNALEPPQDSPLDTLKDASPSPSGPVLSPDEGPAVSPDEGPVLSPDEGAEKSAYGFEDSSHDEPYVLLKTALQDKPVDEAYVQILLEVFTERGLPAEALLAKAQQDAHAR